MRAEKLSLFYHFTLG